MRKIFNGQPHIRWWRLTKLSKNAYDRPTWDLTSVLYAVEGPSYFNISAPGHIVVTDEGATQFTSDDKGKQYYLTVDSIQADKIKKHFVELLSRQPIHFNNKEE